MKLGYCLPFSAFKWFSGSVRGVRATEVQAQILRSGTLGVKARPDIDGSCRDFGLRRISEVSISAFSRLSGNGRCSVLASSHRAFILWRGKSLPFPNIWCRLQLDKGGAAMPHENYAAKQQRIGERLTRRWPRPT